jgi:hypothetical protein
MTIPASVQQAWILSSGQSQVPLVRGRIVRDVTAGIIKPREANFKFEIVVLNIIFDLRSYREDF